MAKVWIVVTAYNYERFLEEAIESALRQTRPADNILLIDDGSVDATPEIGARLTQQHESLEYIRKENGGQLSCFNLVASYVEDSDLVFFLDADDLYHPNYLAYVLENYEKSVDFYYSSPSYFEDGSDLPEPTPEKAGQAADILESTTAITRFNMSWIGSETSTLALSGYLCRLLLPYRHYRDFVTRADDLLVFGASIVGSKKKYLPTSHVYYRVHGSNNFFGTEISGIDATRRRIYLERLKTLFCIQSGLTPTPSLNDVADELANLSDAAILRHKISIEPLSAWKFKSRYRAIRKRLKEIHEGA